MFIEQRDQYEIHNHAHIKAVVVFLNYIHGILQSRVIFQKSMFCLVTC